MSDVGWIDEFVDGWNAFDGDGVAARFAPDGTWEDLAAGFKFDNHEQIREMFTVGAPAWSSDLRTEVEGAICDDARYAFQWHMKGTHNDSGRHIDVRGASVGRLRDGLIVEHIDYYKPPDLPS